MQAKLQRRKLSYKELHYKQNTPEWLNARRIVTASSAAEKCGLGSHNGVEAERIAAVRGYKKDPTPDTEAGHEYEPSVAWRAMELLFCYSPELLKEPEKLVREVGMFVESETEEWLSASPDRVITGHPYKKALVILEVKFSLKKLYEKLKIEYLIQVQIQMHLTGAEFAFLVYGYNEDHESIYLIEYCQPLIDWLMPRMMEFRDSVREDRVCSNVAMAFELESVWNGYRPSKEFIEQHPECNTQWDFWPPKPAYQLVMTSLDYSTDDGLYRNYPYYVSRYSDRREGGVSAECWDNAMGSLFRMGGVRAVPFSVKMHNSDIEVTTVKEQIVIDFVRGRITEEELDALTLLLEKSHKQDRWTAQDHAEAAARPCGKRKLPEMMQLRFSEDAVLDMLVAHPYIVSHTSRFPGVVSFIQGYEPGLLDRCLAMCTMDT